MQQHIDRLQGSMGGTATAANAAQADDATCKRHRFLIIHNPLAGTNRFGLVQKVVRCLEQAGAVVDLRSVADDKQDDSFLREIDTYDALVASGGDGTARSMVTMLRGRSLPFGLIPVGTGNVLAEELNLPRSAAGIAEMLLHGPVVDLSIASVNGAPCLLMLGAGFDGHVIARLPVELKRLIGKPAFGWPILTALACKPRPFSVVIDGTERETTWLLAANASRYAGRFLLSPRTNVLSSGLNVVISRAISRRQRFLELLHLIAGRLEKAKTIEMLPAHVVEIPQAENIPIQVDGEPIASSSFKIVAGVARTPMIVPPSTAQARQTPHVSGVDDPLR